MLLASLALVVLAPVLLVAALGIRLSSPGPIFYRAQRVGRHRTRRASASYDAAIIARTLWVILASLAGQRRFPDPPEMTEARRHLGEPSRR